MSDETEVDFRDLLDQPMSNFPDKPNLPQKRHFYGKLVSLGTGFSKNKGTPFYQFKIRPTAPGDDVPKAWLADVANAGFNINDYEINADFYITPNAIAMLRRFLTSLGFDGNKSFVEELRLVAAGENRGMPTDETQELIRGCEVIFTTGSADDLGRVFPRAETVTGTKTK